MNEVNTNIKLLARVTFSNGERVTFSGNDYNKICTYVDNNIPLHFLTLKVGNVLYNLGQAVSIAWDYEESTKELLSNIESSLAETRVTVDTLQSLESPINAPYPTAEPSKGLSGAEDSCDLTTLSPYITYDDAENYKKSLEPPLLVEDFSSPPDLVPQVENSSGNKVITHDPQINAVADFTKTNEKYMDKTEEQYLTDIYNEVMSMSDEELALTDEERGITTELVTITQEPVTKNLKGRHHKNRHKRKNNRKQKNR